MAAHGARRAAPLSLRARLALLTLAGTLAPIVVLGWLSTSSVTSLQSRVLDERQHLAASVAAHVDSVVNSQLELLETISPTPGPSASARLQVSQSALREAYVRSRFLSGVFLLDAQGNVLQSEPPGVATPLTDLGNWGAVHSAIQTGALEISPLWSAPRGLRRLFLLVALRSPQGAVVGAVAGEIDPAGSRFRHLLDFVPLDPGETVDLVDQNGVVIASTAPGRLYSQADHRHFLEGLIARQQPAVGTCHSCHQNGSAMARVRDVMAFAPLPSRPSWGVDIRQPEEMAFGAALALRWKILAWALGLGVISLVFAWGMASSVTAPLSLLAKTADRIAAGELETPIPELGTDEVGRLGSSLERMRVALGQSLDDVARSRDRLEVRVRERTAEIERLYAELQQRDQLRARLIEKLIGAQEEERRRIARELHDETSQLVGALALALDTALATLPEGASRGRLEEAKAIALRTLDGIHRVSFDLRPSVLDDLGLFRAIGWYADRDLRRRGIAVRCEFEEEDIRLPSIVESAMFRAVQEAIANIVRHARAETVLIQGSCREGNVTIEVEDDGEGFDPSAISPYSASGRGLGLAGIRERMELLGGSALIDSAPGRGTRIVLTAPIEARHG